MLNPLNGCGVYTAVHVRRPHILRQPSHRTSDSEMEHLGSAADSDHCLVVSSMAARKVRPHALESRPATSRPGSLVEHLCSFLSIRTSEHRFQPFALRSLSRWIGT
jgi:hypothetical protein